MYVSACSQKSLKIDTIYVILCPYKAQNRPGSIRIVNISWTSCTSPWTGRKPFQLIWYEGGVQIQEYMCKKPQKITSHGHLALVWRYIDSSGTPRVAGASDLKRSQHYPILFGRCIAEQALQHLPHSQAKANERRPVGVWNLGITEVWVVLFPFSMNTLLQFNPSVPT